MHNVVRKLIDRNITIATAESLTGGLISKIITDVPGASKILKESFVVYSNEAKVNLLGVDVNIIDKYGVVSSEVAFDMAKMLYKKTGKDICVATTGNAGPDICDDKPVGRVYIGISFKNDIKVYECNFASNGTDTEKRDYVRNETAKKVFEEIDKLIS